MNVNSFHSTINSLFGELLEQFKNEWLKEEHVETSHTN